MSKILQKQRKSFKITAVCRQVLKFMSKPTKSQSKKTKRD